METNFITIVSAETRRHRTSFQSRVGKNRLEKHQLLRKNDADRGLLLSFQNQRKSGNEKKVAASAPNATTKNSNEHLRSILASLGTI